MSKKIELSEQLGRHLRAAVKKYGNVFFTEDGQTFLNEEQAKIREAMKSKGYPPKSCMYVHLHATNVPKQGEVGKLDEMFLAQTLKRRRDAGIAADAVSLGREPNVLIPDEEDDIEEAEVKTTAKKTAKKKTAKKTATADPETEKSAEETKQ